jgi:hypothetical protein
VADVSGTASNLFLKMDFNPRSSGLSGAFTAVANDENALFYNPAGLASISKGSIGLNHTQWYEDIKIDNLASGYNWDRKFGVAISAAHLWMPSIQGKDEIGQNTKKINVSSSILQLGFGYKIHPSLYAGLSFKYFRDDLAGYVADGYAFDAGLFMYLFLPGLSFGASVQNIGSEIQYDTRQEKIPFTYRTGLAYKVRGLDLRISVDAVKSNDTDFRFATGLEYSFSRTFFLRFGNKFLPGQNFLPSYGLGLKFNDKYSMAYTFIDHENLGYTHRAGFTFYFDISSSRVITPTYSASKTPVLRAPKNVQAYLTMEKMVVKWDKVLGLRYNVYARTSKANKWKKLNRHPLYANTMEFKKPRSKGKYFIVVRSVSATGESEYSKEVKVNVK